LWESETLLDYDDAAADASCCWAGVRNSRRRVSIWYGEAKKKEKSAGDLTLSRKKKVNEEEEEEDSLHPQFELGSILTQLRSLS
jgi:hypothetical protein